MYKNSLKLIAESNTTITLYHMDLLQSLSKEQEEDLSSVFTGIGFPTKDHEEVYNVLKDWKDKLIAQNKLIRPSAPSKSSIGKSLSKLISNLTSTGICLSLCDYKPIEAQKIYMEVDFRLVHEAFNLWSNMQMQKLSDGFETGVIAAGGSLDGNKNKAVITGSDLPKGKTISFV